MEADSSIMSIRYLVGYDGSESARRAFALALRMAGADDDGHVRAVTVLRTAQAGSETCALMMTDTSSRRARELLDTLRSGSGDMADRVDVALAYGNPGDVLVAQVQAFAIDHIVIGHSAHGALARWLLGSVSGEVISRARVPVTIVP